MRVKIVGEIGINHNGNMEIAKKLIDAAKLAGFDAVKFQKRTIDIVYDKKFLDSYRESPWGITQRAQKEGLEFGENEYDEIDNYCKELGIEWFASSWDIESQIFLRKYNLKSNKVASAILNNFELIETIASERKLTYISTGMSSYEELDQVVGIFRKFSCPFVLLRCCSVYPMKERDANLKLMNELGKRYTCEIGYSGHEEDILTSLAAVARGAICIEKHITLDHSMYGSDQKASIDPQEMQVLANSIRRVESMLGDGEWVLSEEELQTRRKLRGY